MLILGFPGGAVVKNLPTSTGDSRDMGSIPLSGRSPGGGNGNPLQYSCLKNSMDREEEPRWWKNRTERPLSYKFIKRTIQRWTKFTKQLLIASSGHQAPRKAAHCLWREVGQNIKDKKGDKRARDGDPSWEDSLNRGSFQSPGNPRAGRSEGSFQISEGNLTGGGAIK